MKPQIETVSMFDGYFANKCGNNGPVRLSNNEIVKSVSDNQNEIIRWIMALYCPNGFDLDPTYSKGNFYKSIKAPEIKMDLCDSGPGVIISDACNLPLKSGSISSVMFDPPFVAAQPKGKPNGIITKRFSYYKNIQYDLWGMYYSAINEFNRVLKKNGILVFKCQDVIDSSKQYMTHVEVMNQANGIGFYPLDLFILTAKNRIISQTSQHHARKYHSYFWVFRKTDSKVKYNTHANRI